MRTNPNTTVQTQILHVLRKLYDMGVTLNGCGCCGSNELTVVDPATGKLVTYEVNGGFNNLNGSYNYSFYANGANALTITSNGNDENILG
jgi:hypothetical protein